VTRAADLVTVATSTFPYSSTTETLYSDFLQVNQTAAFSSTIQIDNGSDTHRIVHYWDESGDDFHGLVQSTGASADMTGGAQSASRNQISFAAQLNNYAISFDGGGVVTDISGAMPNAASTMRLGANFAATVDNMSIKRLVYVPRRVVDGDLPTWRYNF
jgi:hypothetical protein